METIHTNPEYKDNWPEWFNDAVELAKEQFVNRINGGEPIKPFATSLKAWKEVNPIPTHLKGKEKTIWLCDKILKNADPKTDTKLMFTGSRMKLMQ